MNALVTGAAGFLGRAIVEQLLARGARVRALARRPDPALEALGAELLLGDVRDADRCRQACQNVDTVFHAAAVAGIWGPWRRYYETNTVGTQNIVAACRTAGVRRLVFTSSPSVTFAGQPQCGVDESAPYPTRWLCHYPRSKALAEQAVLAAHGIDGLAACALRPHLIWGPGDQHLIPRLIARARSGQLRRVGDGANLIDTIYIDNAAAAHLQAADALATTGAPGGRAYFLSQGEPVNCWRWIDELLALAGLPPLRKHISLAAAYRIGAALEVGHTLLRSDREPRMTRFLALQLGTSHYFDISAARRDFGYAPLVSTAEGMRRLAAELRAG